MVGCLQAGESERLVTCLSPKLQASKPRIWLVQAPSHGAQSHQGLLFESQSPKAKELSSVSEGKGRRASHSGSERQRGSPYICHLSFHPGPSQVEDGSSPLSPLTHMTIYSGKPLANTPRNSALPVSQASLNPVKSTPKINHHKTLLKLTSGNKDGSHPMHTYTAGLRRAFAALLCSKSL
jgi:hypothetical protein